MVKKRPTFVVENPTPKIEKVVRAIPQWADSGEPIAVQMNAFVEKLVTAKNNPLSESSKSQYVSNMKTIMNRLNHENLDFLVNNVPEVLR